MGKRRPEFRMYSYGKYSKWDRESREIPKLLDFTTEIEAETGTEFGYVLHIKTAKAKPSNLRSIIRHLRIYTANRNPLFPENSLYVPTILSFILAIVCGSPLKISSGNGNSAPATVGKWWPKKYLFSLLND